MIIPIRCFTCSKVLANKYRFYLKEVRHRKEQNKQNPDNVTYLTSENFDKAAAGEVMDELGLTKLCCRTLMMGHVNV